jgi:hypothetical protein
MTNTSANPTAFTENLVGKPKRSNLGREETEGDRGKEIRTCSERFVSMVLNFFEVSGCLFISFHSIQLKECKVLVGIEGRREREREEGRG